MAVSTPRVAVSKRVLNWALKRSRRDAATLSKRLPKLPGWLEGTSEPTLRQLQDFAKATSTPLGYLFLVEPPEEHLPIPHFRTLGDAHPESPSADLLETVQTMERRQEWMREYLVEEGHEPLPFVGSETVGGAPERIAAKIRHVLGLEHGWAAEQRTWTDALRELQERMESASILVVVNGVVGNNTHRKLNPEEFRGFVLVDKYAPLVFVNGADAKAAQMFTLAHELAHLWVGSSAAFDLRELRPADDVGERACNRIAAELLVPENELRKLWGAVAYTPEQFQTIARHFKVSVLVAARRAQDLQLIGQRDYLAFYRSYMQDERRKAAKASTGGDFYANQNFRISRRFANAVIQATSENKLLYRDAYQLTGLRGESFDRYAEYLRIGGAQ